MIVKKTFSKSISDESELQSYDIDSTVMETYLYYTSIGADLVFLYHIN